MIREERQIQLKLTKEKKDDKSGGISRLEHMIEPETREMCSRILTREKNEMMKYRGKSRKGM